MEAIHFHQSLIGKIVVCYNKDGGREEYVLILDQCENDPDGFVVYDFEEQWIRKPFYLLNGDDSYWQYTIMDI